MRRTFGLPSDVRAADQLQKRVVAVGVQPLPAGSPGRATAEHLGIVESDPLTFFVIGDTGGVLAPAPQNAVSVAMQRQPPPRPAFVYHLGDWVYFGGDEAGWEHQVYEPYAHLNVPLVGIPGNHDDQHGGDPPFDPSRGPLDAWMANMCTATPQIPPADPQFEYGRHTQTEPYCDWTLELQALTIIGVYSNVPAGGHFEPGQIQWLGDELKAAPTDRPVIVTLHHPPYSIDTFHGGSQTMGTALDEAFSASGRVPELILSGHVHDYQRFTRTIGSHQAPYVVSGNGGYHNLHQLASDVTPGEQLAPDVIFEFGDASRYGFVQMTVSGGKIAGEYVGVKPGTMPDGSDARISQAVDRF